MASLWKASVTLLTIFMLISVVFSKNKYWKKMNKANEKSFKYAAKHPFGHGYGHMSSHSIGYPTAFPSNNFNRMLAPPPIVSHHQYYDPLSGLGHRSSSSIGHNKVITNTNTVHQETTTAQATASPMHHSVDPFTGLHHSGLGGYY